MKILMRTSYALVDEEDEDLALLKWHSSNRYAMRHTPTVNGSRTKQHMHRVILERVLGRILDRSEHVDHINMNRNDNRRSNLRLASRSENMHNRPKPKSNTTGYKGVFMNKGRATARTKTNQTVITVGRFDTVEEAAWMYDQWALELHGDHARLNFDYVGVKAQL